VGRRLQRILLTAVLLASAGQSELWRDPERWRQLRIGMTRYQVLRLLGEPGKITRYYAFERWEYPDALGKRVNFDERGRLSVWGALAR
jgi:outer membrane protein assembly factor BamE (lipoprotein component of BamABCDE complex)